MKLRPRATRAVFAVLLLSFCGRLISQTRQTADQRIRLQAYGLFTYVRPVLYNEPKNLGVTLGADVDGYRFLPFTELGLDARYMKAGGGEQLNMSSLSGGPRVSYNAFRLRPYVDFTIGIGYGSFPKSTVPTYTHDSNRTIGYGGGVDYRLNRSWSIRADAQRQRWRFTHFQPYSYPVMVSVGVSYQVHLPSRTGPRY